MPSMICQCRHTSLSVTQEAQQKRLARCCRSFSAFNGLPSQMSGWQSLCYDHIHAMMVSHLPVSGRLRWDLVHVSLSESYDGDIIDMAYDCYTSIHENPIEFRETPCRARHDGPWWNISISVSGSGHTMQVVPNPRHCHNGCFKNLGIKPNNFVKDVPCKVST